MMGTADAAETASAVEVTITAMVPMDARRTPAQDVHDLSCKLVLNDSTSNPVFLWLVNHVELPLANLLMHKGDVRIYSRKELTEMCRQSGLVMEAFENSGVWHLHAVIRKSRG